LEKGVEENGSIDIEAEEDDGNEKNPGFAIPFSPMDDEHN
jgi:hypothetical protein